MPEIKFQCGSDPFILNDVIVLTDEEYANITQDEIDKMKIKRYIEWHESMRPTIEEYMSKREYKELFPSVFVQVNKGDS